MALNKYDYDDLIINPKKAQCFVGRQVFYGDNPLDCLNHANHRQGVSSKLISIASYPTQKPFILEASDKVLDDSPLMFHRSASCIIIDRKYPIENIKGRSQAEDMPPLKKEAFDLLSELEQALSKGEDLLGKLDRIIKINSFDMMQAEDAFDKLKVLSSTLGSLAFFLDRSKRPRKPINLEDLMNHVSWHLCYDITSSLHQIRYYLERLDIHNAKLDTCIANVDKASFDLDMVAKDILGRGLDALEYEKYKEEEDG